MAQNEPETELCQECGGTRWILVEKDGVEIARRCKCALEAVREKLLENAMIPERYRHCTLENFDTRWFERYQHLQEDNTLEKAHSAVREFVDTYPFVEKGLLLMGGVGTGKTHLAVAALKQIMAEKRARVRGRFVDFTSLVLEIQMTFDGPGSSSEILKPLVEADLLVLDELGAGKTTQWVMDLLYYLVNTRYLEGRVTIFTTNFSDHPKNNEDPLTNRVSKRIRSRLYEMCRKVGLYGHDYRAEHLATREGRPLQ